MQEKPSVCILTSVHRSSDVRIYQKQARSLAGAGYPVTLISPGSPPEERSDVRFIEFKKPKSRFLRILLSPFQILRLALGQKSKIYHFHDPELIFTGFCLRLLRKKVIYDAHEDVPRQILSKPWIKPFLRRLLSGLFECYENLFCRIFTRVVTATPEIQRRFLKVNKNTVHVGNYPILNETGVSAADYDSRPGCYCYIGAVSRVRGIREAVQAAADIKAPFILAGDFDSPALYDEIRALPGWANTDFRGFVGRQEVAAILSSARAGLVTLHPIPNYMESLPIKMFEYMAAGVPVVASDFPYWRKIIEGESCGVCVDPLDPPAIAAAIAFILDNPEKAREMGENGRRLALSKYNWENEKQKLLAMYESILSG
ncbi:MAG TPA: glycosyl transferase [Ruminococcaceae bacterium]|nr:glycosyl transferase [Oscillospiraceae bacterium]